MAEDRLDLVELLLAADERRGELDDGVAAVVCPADEAGVEEGGREEASQQELGLLVVEGLPRLFVPHELYPVEVAVAPHLAHYRQVGEPLEGGAEGCLVLPDV